jgi:hypothetical protein
VGAATPKAWGLGVTLEELRASGKAFISAKDVLGLIPISRPTAYMEMNRYVETGGTAGIPCRRIGRRLLIPVGPFLAWCGDGHG